MKSQSTIGDPTPQPCRTPDPVRASRSVEERLIAAAKRWASFQEGDSLEDQATDTRLKAEAIEAREQLLEAVYAMEGK